MKLFFIYHIILSFIIVLFSLLSVSFFTLWERKLLSGIQRRHGPVIVGVFGILQPFADGLKLLFKAVSVPSGVYYNVYFLSSLFSLTLSVLAWSVIPFNSRFIYADINLNLIFILALSSLNVYSILFSGWSSNSKYGLLGSIRSGAQMISYELPMSLALLSVILFNSTANLTNIIIYQSLHQWNVFILLPSFFIFLVTALAETNRTPFDLPEAESELVAGYNMEYSSMVFALFFLAEYNQIMVMSMLIVILFFGGWNIFPVSHILDSLVNEYLHAIIGVWLYYFFSFDDAQIYKLLGDFLYYYWYYNEKTWLEWYYEYGICKKEYYFFLSVETIVVFIKSTLFSSLFVVIRACVPRYKFTQLLKLCWEVFIPVSFVFFLFCIFF